MRAMSQILPLLFWAPCAGRDSSSRLQLADVGSQRDTCGLEDIRDVARGVRADEKSYLLGKDTICPPMQRLPHSLIWRSK